MNYIRHLAGFFDRVANDDRLGPLHISMYVSLFQFWNANRFSNPISISRSELMRVSKISAKATYHKCIKELNNYGYLRYEPSFNPIRGSLVHLFNFETGVEQLEERNHTKIETGFEQVDESRRTKIETASRQLEEPYINNINIINNKTYEQSIINTSSNFDRVDEQGDKAKKENSGGRRKSLPASVTEVQLFFEQEGSAKIEGEKFYNYFQSNGWKVGGRAAMKDWQAAARSWILNAGNFGRPKNTRNLQGNRNYAEPL